MVTTTMSAVAGCAVREPLGMVSVASAAGAVRSATVAQNLAGATRLEAAHVLVEQFAAMEASRDGQDRVEGRSSRPVFARLDPAARARDQLVADRQLTIWHATRLVTAGRQVHTRLPRLRKAVARGLLPEGLAIDTACRLAAVDDAVVSAVESEVITWLARDLDGGHRPSRCAVDGLIDDGCRAS